MNSNLNCSSSNGHDMTFLNNTNTTVLPDFQYLTSPSSEQQLTPPPSLGTTANNIPVYPIPKSVDCNQYGNNITNNNHSNLNHVRKVFSSKELVDHLCLQIKQQQQQQPPTMNSFTTQQPITNIGRIMTGLYINKYERIFIFQIPF